MSTTPRMKTADDAFDETLILWASPMMVSGISKDRSYCRQNRGHCDVPDVAVDDLRTKNAIPTDDGNGNAGFRRWKQADTAGKTEEIAMRNGK